MGRSFAWVFPLCLVAVFGAGCSSHKGLPPAKPKPVVLTADDHHAKVIFRMLSTESQVSFSAGPVGNLSGVGVVYNDSLEQQAPAFVRGLYKGLAHGLYRARPFRETLVPADQLTVVEGVANWRNDRGTSYSLEKCGPLSRSFLPKANKTYLVEFDLQGFSVCSEKVYDVTVEGQKELVLPVAK
ncbi:hypothetical protein J2Y83_003875 [Pseudomonas marginalis]|uniref:hypothetical protein n=1 Tax=Pseudomonas marginalis TaxID=298 RepID=UPI00209D1C5A|nr:hypothetical protein [Pseudomonas marginalis]MCP1507902.1 hypothetical protein [Pseudomonas marginalis]MCP1525406.1 hypothetical protein [Pseudomonas marginalis]MDQ0499280.1 hypothetical protein [Pseudomonas marginalis]